jgi:hypothetical protein
MHVLLPSQVTDVQRRRLFRLGGVLTKKKQQVSGQ